MIDTTRTLISTHRPDFPIFQREIHGQPLSYLDSAATSQKPLSVIETMNTFYRTYNANIHRGAYTISEEATLAYEQTRSKVARFINARSTKEIIYVRGTTEGINLVASSWGRKNIQAGDVIVLTELEHHSNLVPWQILAEEKGARLEFIGLDDHGMLNLDDLDRHLALNPKLVALNWISNSLGTINPVHEIIRRAHAAGALVLIDGAQSTPHRKTDVRELDCDFLTFSSHKMCGPTGMGILYGKRALLEDMPPYQGGGDMIKNVTLRKTTYNDLPWKFEAGTPAIAEVIGLGAAIDYLESVGLDHIADHEHQLLTYAMEQLSQVEGLTIYGPPVEHRAGIVTFTFRDIHPHDLATILDTDGVCIRAGHHCCQPMHERYGLTATARASFYLYSESAEVDRLVGALQKARTIFEG